MRCRIIAGSLLLVLAAACDQNSTAPASLSAADAAELAPQFEALADASFAGAAFSTSVDGARLDVTTATLPFARTVACPAGGSVAISGSAAYTADVAARTGSYAVTATRVESGCAFTVRGSAVKVDGDPSTTVNGSQSVTRGVPGTRTVTQKGAFKWSRAGGASGSCPVDLVSTFDPAAGIATVKGNFCGRSVDVKRTRGA